MLGDPVSFVAKLLIGGGLLTLLILLIWGPLLIIALINTTNVSNPPVEVSIQFSVRSFEVNSVLLGVCMCLCLFLCLCMCVCICGM